MTTFATWRLSKTETLEQWSANYNLDQLVNGNVNASNESITTSICCALNHLVPIRKVTFSNDKSVVTPVIL